MNRIISTSLVAFALALAFPAFAFASTISISPIIIPVTSGKVFTVKVTINPQGAKIYTANANLSFDPALIKVDKFVRASGWTFDVPGGAYNNTAGTLTEGAGLIGGFTAPKVLGTITFVAKATGTAHIVVTSKSKTLDTGSKNTISGTQGSASVFIAAPKKYVPSATHKTTYHKTAAKKRVVSTHTTASKTSHAAATVAAATSSATSTAVAGAAQQASAAGATASTTSTTGGHTMVIDIIIALLIIALILWWFARKRSTTNSPTA